MLALALLLATQTAAPSTSTSSTTTAPSCRIVVLDLQAKDLDAGEASLPGLLTETLATEAARVSGCQVVTSADVRAMLDFEATKAAACVDGATSCLAEIGSALGAERVIGGTVTALNGEFIVSARLMNVTQGGVEARTEQVAAVPAQQRWAAQNAARALFHQALLPAPETPPPSTTTPPTTPPTSTLAPALWTTAAVGAGIAVLGGGGAIAAEWALGTAEVTGKSSIANLGLVSLALGTVGAVVAVGGGAAALLESP